jgi:hypothetical protein
MNSPMLEAAFAYANRNVSVFPCERKVPLTTGGFKNATCDMKQLIQWWSKNPKAQIGVPTGHVNNLVVLDVDSPEAAEAVGKMNLPPSFTVQTRSGRWQIWFRQPEGAKSKNSVEKLGAKLDVRGDGGYVIAPPSVHHETNEPYRVVKDLPWAEAPAFLLESSSGNGNSHSGVDIIPEGQRHRTLLALAGSLRARGFSRDMVLSQLRITNQQCVPPKPESELEAIADYVNTKPAGSFERAIETSAELDLESFSGIAPEAIHWLWPNRIPAGKLTLFVGDPGKGKTLVALDLAARLGRRNNFPDGARSEQADSLILSAEDSASDTLRPRLDAAGADVSRVYRIKAVRVTLANGESGESSFSLERDLMRLEDALKKNPGLRLIILDPLSAYVGTKVNSWRDAEVRALLTPLVEFAARCGVAVIGIMHMRKSETDAMLRVSGSIAFVAAARVVWGFGEDPENQATRVMVPVKNNLAPLGDSLTYQITSTSDATPYLLWDKQTRAIDANEVLGMNAKEKRDRAEKMTEARDWLRQKLLAGPVPQDQIKAGAEQKGIAWRTLRRAKDSLRVKSHKSGIVGGWYWELPEPVHEEGQ